MKKILSYLLAAIFLLAANNSLANQVSGGGRNPPKSLSTKQIDVLKRITSYLSLKHKKEDPIEIVAIAMVETNLKEGLISHTGDYGVLQVNCKVHKKKLAKVLGLKNCRKDMFILEHNIDAAVLILGLFRKYRACRKTNLYSCYNGGQGWRVVAQKCRVQHCGNQDCRRCNRPARYASSVKKHIRFLKRKYSHLFTTEGRSMER